MRIDRNIISTRFACDLAACKGACCTFPGGSGAPLREDEVAHLARAWEAVRQLVPEEHREEVREHGMVEHDGEELTVRCYDDRACVFVMYEGDVALCSIQYLHMRGEFSWPKPVSCHLFPIRIRKGKRPVMRFERFSECSPALDAGEQQEMPLVDFLEVPLRRAVGDEMFMTLKQRSDSHHNGSAGTEG